MAAKSHSFTSFIFASWQQHGEPTSRYQLSKKIEKHLADFISINKHQRGKINADYCLYYKLDFQPYLPIKNLTVEGQDHMDQITFANAVLGPTLNYESPSYTFPDEKPLSEDLIKTIT